MNNIEAYNTLSVKMEDAIEVEIKDEVYQMCYKFANEVNPTTKYGDCGQNDMNKRMIDNLIGKIGEFAVWFILKHICSLQSDSPDCNIYKGKQKSWKSDLLINTDDGNINCAVKTQSLSQAIKYGLSGTFQIASFRKDKVFDSKNELIFLCLVDDNDENLCYKRILVLPPKKITDIKFSDPKLLKFKGIKTCYYAHENFDKEKLLVWLTKFSSKFGEHALS